MAVVNAFEVPAWQTANLPPRYNLASSGNAAVVRNECGERRLSMLRLGLIPAWAKDSGIGHKLINAQAETAEVKPSFPAAFSKRRCLVLVDGFNEWRREGSVRTLSLIAWPDEGLMAFAELWEHWRVPSVRSFAARSPNTGRAMPSRPSPSLPSRRTRRCVRYNTGRRQFCCRRRSSPGTRERVSGSDRR